MSKNPEKALSLETMSPLERMDHLKHFYKTLPIRSKYRILLIYVNRQITNIPVEELKFLYSRCQKKNYLLHLRELAKEILYTTQFPHTDEIETFIQELDQQIQEKVTYQPHTR